MKKIYFGTLLSSFFVIGQSFSVENNGLDKPIQVNKVNLGKNQKENTDIIKTCFVYSDFIVSEFNDQNSKGGAKIGIDKSKTNSSNVCNKKLNNFSYKKTLDGYFTGKIGNYFVVEGSDGYAGNYLIQVLELSKNKLRLIFEDNRNMNSSYQFQVVKNNQLSLKYWKALKNTSECSLTAGSKDDSCWKKILAENNIADSDRQKLNLKDCFTITPEMEEYSKLLGESVNELPLHSFINVEVSDIKFPKKFKVVDSSVKCAVMN